MGDQGLVFGGGRRRRRVVLLNLAGMTSDISPLLKRVVGGRGVCGGHEAYLLGGEVAEADDACLGHCKS
jgi:hypothetical protein